MSDKLQGGIKAGSTSVSLCVILRKTADNTEKTGVAAAGVTSAYYWRQGGTPTTITALSDLAAITTAWAAGGWKEADATHAAGAFRLDVDDAAFATGADWVEIAVTVSGCYVFHERFALTTNVVQTGDSFARIGAAGANLTNITGVTLAASQPGVTIPTVTNLTNAPTAGDFTAAMKTSLNAASIDVNTIKGQGITCAAPITINPFVGNATHAIVVDSSGSITFNNTTIAGVTTTTNLTNAPTAGDFTATMKASLNNATPAVTVSDKTGFSLSSSGVDLILTESGIVASANLINDSASQLTSINLRQSIALIQAACAGILAGAATTDVTIKAAALPAGSTRIDCTVDSSGNRSAATLKVPT